MLYIQLPDSASPANVKHTKSGYFYFETHSEVIFLQDLASFKQEGVYHIELSDGSRLSGTVTKCCPNEDRNYAEYLLKKEEPSQWCKVVNGIEKNNEMAQTLTRIESRRGNERYHFLTAQKKGEALESGDNSKEDFSPHRP